MPICPFCRKNVDPNTVWCTCGINLSRYPNLPTATAEIKVWLAKYEPESLGSSQPEGSLLELARRNLMDEQETEFSKKTRNTGELSEEKKLIDDFLSDCQRAGLAPTIDIGQLRRDRWRQWRRIPTEYRQNPPMREFRLTPGYLFETNVAKFQDEFCLAIDGTIYKHQLNAPDPFPLEELLNQVPLNKLAEGLTFSLVWLLKAKQRPEAIDEKTAATGRKSEPAAEPAGKKTGFRLPFGRGKEKKAEAPVPFPIPAVDEFDSPATAAVEAGAGSASAGVETIAGRSAEKLGTGAEKPGVKAEELSSGSDAGVEKPDASGAVTVPPAVEEEIGTRDVAKRNKKLGLRLPFGRAKVAGTPASSPSAPQTAATDQTAAQDIVAPPIKPASRFKLPFSFKKAAVPEASDASRQESASGAGSLEPAASTHKKAEPVPAVNKKEAAAISVDPAQTTATIEPGPASDGSEKDLLPLSENDDGPIVAPLKSQKAENGKKSFWPGGRKEPAMQAESDEGETKKGLKLPFRRGKKPASASASAPTAELPIASVQATAPAIETKTPSPESMTAATGAGVEIETPKPVDQAVAPDATLEVKTVSSPMDEVKEKPAPTVEKPKLEEITEPKSDKRQETPMVSSTSAGKSADATPVPDEHGAMVYTKRSAPKSRIKWPFSKSKTDSTASPTTPAQEPPAKATAAPPAPQAPQASAPENPAKAEMTAEPPATPTAKQPATVTASTTQATPETQVPAPKDTATAGPAPTADSRVARKEASEGKKRSFWPFGRKVKDPESTATPSAGGTPEPRAPKPVAGAGRPSPSPGMATDPSAGATKPGVEPKPAPKVPTSSAGADVDTPKPGGGTAPRPNPSAVRPNPGARVGAPRPGVGAPRPGAGANAGAPAPAPRSGVRPPGVRPPGARPAASPSNQAPAARHEQATEPKGKRWFWPFGGKKKDADGTAAPSTAMAPKPMAPRPGPGGGPRSGAGTAPRTAPGAQKPMGGAFPGTGTNAGAPRPPAAGAPANTPQRPKPGVSAPRPSPEAATAPAPKPRPNATAAPGTFTGPARPVPRPKPAPTEPVLQGPATKAGNGNGEGLELVAPPEQTKN